MVFVVLCLGTPEGSTGSGSGFKVSQKTGQWLKVSSDRLGEAGNRTCDPWFTRHRFIPYTTAASQFTVNMALMSHDVHKLILVWGNIKKIFFEIFSPNSLITRLVCCAHVHVQCTFYMAVYLYLLNIRT